MRILFVAFPHSIHVVRWIAQIADQDWDLHLFPSIDNRDFHPDFENITIHLSVYGTQDKVHPSVKITGFRVGVPFFKNFNKRFFRWLSFYLYKLLLKFRPHYQIYKLKRVIRKIKPDIIHSIEFQHAGYLTLDTKQLMQDGFPPWVVTNYGSDLYLFGRLKEHQEKVRAILEQCDYYDCECERDVEIAQSMGLRGKVIRPILPNAGGIDFDKFEESLWQRPVSGRKQIILKGYQHFAGRALFGLQALKQCADLLREYKVVVYSANDDVKIALQLFQLNTGIEVEILSNASHQEIMGQFARSRIYIGLSISDAISTSLLEAMAMGVFPIQSNTACADEWIVDGESGFIVPPEDIIAIEQAIRCTITDDALVDNAAQLNLQIVKKRLDINCVKPQVVGIYETIYKERRI